ncbi:MAG: indolepyruvate ferredoxin oxidoreductase subunit alpha [Gracilibacteraceae bacterium]|jgi:indolepyruvate ferredoxin oxidoreductase alpha subunit|nr:indolepyruvate ferredoxin oxidoreductase subunit alpha [Gracilibacteraceae bacterium]
MKQLMTGNEAIARGAWEAGVLVCTAYPGTPSTEITENAARYEQIYAEWSPNEKVALEVGLGASIAGGRALVAMKHVGVNVAADPLFTAAYTGVTGGLVLVSADDPGMHSSQNEQDNRHLARAAKIPVLEPADSQEAKDFTKYAFALSEEYDTPVMLRITTRVAHSQSLVELGEREERTLAPYVKNSHKYVMIPAYARPRHTAVEARLTALGHLAETTPLNRVEWGDRSIGVVTGGIAYQYLKEVRPEVSVLKLGLSYPLPRQKITEFARSVTRLYVAEELEDFWESQLRAWGLDVCGKEIFPRTGELQPEIVAAALAAPLGHSPASLEHSPTPPTPPAAALEAPARPPVLCPGCPHRALFYVLRKMRLVVAGDIGCYTLGCLEPLDSVDTTICMGASIGTAIGMEKTRGREFGRRLVAVIGDSTFIHSGVTGLIDAVYNNAPITLLILDNRTTGMTGHQDNPVTGRTLQGEAYREIDLTRLCRAVGVDRVTTVDPFDLKLLEQTIRAELAAEEPSVIITRRKCALIDREAVRPPLRVERDKCTQCLRCMRLGCPCLALREGETVIDAQCTGCGLCARVCAAGAIGEAGEQ